MPAVGPDVSYYQRLIDGSFDCDVFICRHSDGDFIDPNFATNWARATANPRIGVVAAYHVFRPASDAVQARRADRIRSDTRGIGCAMIDAETWQGQIRGDQSGGLNTLWQLLTARFGGNPRRVWGYANRGDWASMWPSRPGGMPMMVASYGPTKPTWAANMMGWQYTDGQTKYGIPAGMRWSTPPFGPCDHNAFPAFASGRALAAWIGSAASTATASATPLSQEDDSMSAQDVAELKAYIDQRLGAVAQRDTDESNARAATEEQEDESRQAQMLDLSVGLRQFQLQSDEKHADGSGGSGAIYAAGRGVWWHIPDDPTRKALVAAGALAPRVQTITDPNIFALVRQAYLGQLPVA